MLYPTNNQPIMLLVLVIIGIGSGIIFDVLLIINTLLGNDKIAHQFFQFLGVIFSFSLLFIANLHFNYGQFRWYVLLVYLGAFFLQRTFSRFLWTRIVKKCYSIISKKKE